MKNIYFFLLAAGFFITSCGPSTVIHSDNYQPAPVAPAPVHDLSYQSFYDQLSPYGTWINYPGYGYVWMPNAGPDFRPYATNGNWIYTDAGWTWASGYSWGWAPFHYGRWFYENGYGWMWIPGNEWAPAWVSWRGSGDYYGWAPLSPQIPVDMALTGYNPPVYYWNFVPSQYMGNPGWHNYYVNDSRNLTIIKTTTIINNYSGTNRSLYPYAPGPDPNEVRRVSRNNFTQVQLRESETPGERISGDQYTIYHPRVNAAPAYRGNAAGRPSTPAPARYESFSEMHPSTQNSSYNRQVYNQPSNNPGPPVQNPENDHTYNNQQPVNNPGSSARNSAYNQEANNQQANNPTSTGQNPGNNQANNNAHPANNPAPAGQNPGYSQANNNAHPANNPTSTGQNPGNNQANNNAHPANNPAPAGQNPGNNQTNNNAHPANNPPPAGQNPNQNRQTAQLNQPANNHLNDPRTNRFNPPPANTHPVQTSAMPNPSAVNHVQNTGRPETVHNPNNGKPVQGTEKPERKPEQNANEKPKPGESNSN